MSELTRKYINVRDWSFRNLKLGFSSITRTRKTKVTVFG